MSHGVRYLEVSDFIRYSEKLKVRVTKNELEYYEENGLMLPAARVILPEEFVQLVSDKLKEEIDADKLKKWPEIERLEAPRLILSEDYKGLTDDDLIEPFDREFNNNPYLFKPTPQNFQAWNTYKVTVTNRWGQELPETRAIHYYSYWQVHQLYAIRSRTKIYEYRKILPHLSNEIIKQRLEWPLRNTGPLREFHGKHHWFDALSFFMRLFSLERQRTFALVPVKRDKRTLNEEQFEKYRDRLSKHAHKTATRYSLNESTTYEFLKELLRLKDDYESVERARLAYEIEKDIRALADFIMLLTEKDWNSIGEELGRSTNAFVKRDFLHLNHSVKVYDVAREVLLDEIRQLTKSIKHLTTTDISLQIDEKFSNEILEYCQNTGVDLLATTLDDMRILIPIDGVPPGEELRKYQESTQYTSLKNLATSFEYFLRAVGEKSGSPVHGEKKLDNLVLRLMKNEPWCRQFIGLRRFTTGREPRMFRSNYNEIVERTEAKSGEYSWARTFALACLARNFTVHFYPTDHWFYDEMLGELISATTGSILYSWYIAKREKWV